MKPYSDKFKEELNKYLNSKVDIISEMPAKDDEKYFINGYHGCGDYLLAVLEGKIVATIHGSYANTLVFKPYEDGDIRTWINFVKEFFTEKFGVSNSYNISIHK